MISLTMTLRSVLKSRSRHDCQQQQLRDGQADRVPRRALKAPRIRETAARLADQARDAGWSHEEYLAAVLDREVSARNSSGAQLRIRAAGFGPRKTIEDFIFDHQPGLKRDTIAHLATGVFVAKAENVVLLGPPVINGS